MNRRIVVLDGATLNPGDLDWSGFEALGECLIHDRTPPEQVVVRAGDASVLLTNKTPLSRSTLARLPAVRYIGVLATGFNVVDLPSATRRRIPVTNVPGYGTGSVAQLVFAHVLEWARQVGRHDASVRDGDWSACPDFCYTVAPQHELTGMTFGIIGFGRIGRAVARLALALGMEVLVCRRDGLPGREGEVTFLDTVSLLSRADIVSLHCPLTPVTRHLINRRTLALMKPGAFLVNTGRGDLIDEEALCEALQGGRLAGAGLDVLSVEPPTDNPLFRAPDCRITPHIGWATRAARARLMAIAAANLRGFLDGTPANVVNPEALARNLP